jgi:hypothetical protein
MSGEDEKIWRRYWGVNAGDAVALYFDVGVGLPDQLPRTDDPNMMFMWIRNTQKRIDVVVERVLTLDLIEVKFRPTANVVGQMLVSGTLFHQDNPFNKPAVPMILTDREDSELRGVAEASGLRWVVV